MKLRSALALVLAALLIGLAGGAYLGARIVLGRTWRGLGSIFGAPAVEPAPVVVPGRVVPGEVVPW